MQSFLIISHEEDKGRKTIETYCNIEHIDPLDVTFFSPGFEKKKQETALSFGIEAVREIQKSLYLKPHRGDKKAIVILQADVLTLPAQNAFLKILEEPPHHTLIFLLSSSLDVFLPTIRSRCLIIDTKEVLVLTPKELEQIKERITLLQLGGISTALKQAELLARDTKKAVRILEYALVFLRQSLLEEASNKELDQPWQVSAIKSLVEAHRVLKKTNTNPRITLERAFFTLSQK